MATVETFEDLEIWQNARKIANAIYDLSESGLFSLDFGLKDQMRRAAISVMSNISEGFESPTQKPFINYLGHAKASAGELRSQLYISMDRKYIPEVDFNKLTSELRVCSRQIQSLIRYLNSQPNARRVQEEGNIYDL